MEKPYCPMTAGPTDMSCNLGRCDWEAAEAPRTRALNTSEGQTWRESILCGRVKWRTAAEGDPEPGPYASELSGTFSQITRFPKYTV